MPDIVLGLGGERFSLTGAGPFPSTPVPGAIDPQHLRWGSTYIQFQTQYTQVLLLAGSNLTRLTLRYTRRPAADLTTFQTYFRATAGMEGTFPYTHPVEGWTRRMRFARPILAWAVYPHGAKFYDFVIELEEAP